MSSRREFNSLLSKASDEASAYTGIDHKFTAVDAAAAPQADGGDDHRQKMKRDKGIVQPKKSIIV